MSGSCLAFIIGSVFLVIYNWFGSIREKRYHGIPRFIAFEGILALIILNVPYWFRSPFCPRQVLSWIALAASIYFALSGYITLKSHGRSEGKFENTSRLVEKGLYKYIRHPMYLSLALGSFGVFLKYIDLYQGALLLGTLLALVITVKVEEKELQRTFGEEYRGYMNRTNAFIPGIW